MNIRPYAFAFALFLAGGSGSAIAKNNDVSEAPVAKQHKVKLKNMTLFGDFDQMLEHRIIRVAVPYSRTLFFVDKGKERGITAETVRDFERYINKKYAKKLGKRPITVTLIATTRDKLLPMLNEGLVDIAAGNLTDTEERRKLADFVAPHDNKPVRELLATGPNSPEVKTIDDLAGKTVHVRPSTSYAESLSALNDRLKTAGKPLVKIVPLPDALEDEDKLEMLNAGLLDFVVVDDWIGKMWAQILPKIKIREDIVLRNDSYIGWAIRKDSPKLKAEILDAYVNFGKKLGVIAYRMAKYHKGIKQITNNSGVAERKRFENTIALFQKYGNQYGFDPLMLTAQGYQESQLRQEARSRSGAIGVMQILLSTGKSLKVGNIRQIEPNIHGGAKYMDKLMAQYFKDAKFSDIDRSLFAFASYNAGPGNVSKMRKEASKRGLNPDIWFNNVEVVTAEKIGTETTSYVRNIFKYYIAYKLTQTVQAARCKAREQVAPATHSNVPSCL